MTGLNRLTVNQMAKLNGISSQALRLYSNIGLINPISIDLDTRYRYYDIRQSYNIDIIVYLKSLGMSLAEIKEYFDNESICAIFDSLNSQLKKIELEENRLKAVKSSIQQLIDRIQIIEHKPQMNTILLERIPTRFIHGYKIKSDLHADGSKVYEKFLRDMKIHFNSKGLPLNYFTNVGSIITQSDFLKHDFISSEIFIYGDIHSKKILDAKVIEEGDYLCCYFDDYDKEIAFRELLLKEIKVKDYQVTGDFICEPIMEFPILNKIDRKSIIRIQIPVVKR